MADYESLHDEEELHKMMGETEDFDERKKIRLRLKTLREEKTVEWEAAKAARETEQVDRLAERHAAATAKKAKDLQLMKQNSEEKRNKKPSVRELDIKARHENARKDQVKALQTMKDMSDMRRDHMGAGTDRAVKEGVESADKSKGKDRLAVQNGTPRSCTTGGGKGESDEGVGEYSGDGANVTRSPSSIKQLLLEWCARMTAGYQHVDVKNFSSSWNDGMAFCALIHHFYPRAFDYSKLNPKCRRGNFKLAFEVSEKLGNIAPFLEVDDMVKMKNPDWKCVFTYIQQYYKRFRNFDPADPSTHTDPTVRPTHHLSQSSEPEEAE